MLALEVANPASGLDSELHIPRAHRRCNVQTIKESLNQIVAILARAGSEVVTMTFCIHWCITNYHGPTKATHLRCVHWANVLSLAEDRAHLTGRFDERELLESVAFC